jgi:hypothetical protein
MTRNRIIELLTVLVEEMGNKLPPPYPLGTDMQAVAFNAAEWAYVKGLAAGAVLELRDRLIAEGS